MTGRISEQDKEAIRQHKQREKLIVLEHQLAELERVIACRVKSGD